MRWTITIFMCKDSMFNKPCCCIAVVFSHVEILVSLHSEQLHLLKILHCPVFDTKYLQQLQYTIWALDGSSFQLFNEYARLLGESRLSWLTLTLNEELEEELEEDFDISVTGETCCLLCSLIQRFRACTGNKTKCSNV